MRLSGVLFDICGTPDFTALICTFMHYLRFCGYFFPVVRDAEVAGSNPVASTLGTPEIQRFRGSLFLLILLFSSVLKFF